MNAIDRLPLPIAAEIALACERAASGDDVYDAYYSAAGDAFRMGMADLAHGLLHEITSAADLLLFTEGG
jgi:hypothetical protein